jgi:tetratricopeptide (TPR) repeat protein
VHSQLGELDESLRLYQQTLDDALRARHEEGLAVALEGKAKVLVAAGRPDEAIPLLEEAQPNLEQLEDEQGRVGVVSRLATLYTQLGRPQDAIAAWGTMFV